MFGTFSRHLFQANPSTKRQSEEFTTWDCIPDTCWINVMGALIRYSHGYYWANSPPEDIAGLMKEWLQSNHCPKKFPKNRLVSLLSGYAIGGGWPLRYPMTLLDQSRCRWLLVNFHTPGIDQHFESDEPSEQFSQVSITVSTSSEKDRTSNGKKHNFRKDLDWIFWGHDITLIDPYSLSVIRTVFFICFQSVGHEIRKPAWYLLLMEKIRLTSWGWYHDLQSFIHPRWWSPDFFLQLEFSSEPSAEVIMQSRTSSLLGVFVNDKNQTSWESKG